MSDDDLHEHDEHVEPGTIGVGMGGSCPVCRAPVDLGQEFCLECGSPIRFTPRQRRQPRPGARPATGAAPPPPRKSGFPWVPFLVVLALVGAGVAFALVEGGKDNTSSKGKDNGTEAALPTITNETPETTSSTETTTLQDCDPGQPLGGTQPAVTDDSALDPGTDGEQIPSLSTDGSDTSDPADDFASSDIPSIEPTETDSSVTVDQNGNLCASQDGTSPGGTDTGGTDTSGTDTGGTDTGGTNGSGTPVDTTNTDTDTSGSGSTASGDWPSGKQGWTVIVAGYPTEERATQRAADVQEDGFDDSGVLFSTDFLSLCPGIHVVFSGVFDAKGQADKRLDALAAKPDYAGMYVREIKTSGTRPSGCTQVRTQN
ncbi:MAG: hypothetical protein JWL76_124 [Thermoleophilia bacterium]|nr:hypothetical protein [Thermoleophilia bacterium]